MRESSPLDHLFIEDNVREIERETVASGYIEIPEDAKERL
jgi:hypothetical protein